MDIELHEHQSTPFSDMFVDFNCRFQAICCSRGWGKSFLGGSAGVKAASELMMLSKDVPNKNVFIIAPTFDQARDIYFPLLNYDLGLENWTVKPASQDLGRFVLPNRVELRLLSYEAIARMRGKGAYFVLWDEVSSCNKGMPAAQAWKKIIKPAITTRWSWKNAKKFGAKHPGRAILISTPDGYNFFYDACNFPEVDPTWKYYNYDYKMSPYLDPEEIERDRLTMDPIEFASEYEAKFAESGNRVFYCFDRKEHVRNDLEDFKKGEIINVGIDFNVGIMASSLFAIRGGQMQFLDCIKGLPDTEHLAISLRQRFPEHKIHAYPDPTGKSRKTSAAVGKTDFTILKEHGIEVFARSASPSIIDSVRATNRMLKTASGKISMFFHPRAASLIESMEKTKWADKNPDVALIDKTEGKEHFSDSVRYPTEFLHPVQSGSRVSKGFRF
jgi:hypothetical protein